MGSFEIHIFQISSPACTELEITVMDWLGKLLKLPEDFLSGGRGGGVIQVSSDVSFPAELLHYIVQ